MIKQRLTLMASLAMAIAVADVQAVALNPKGLGQVLIYPYYTVNKGQDTLLSIVNTGEASKFLSVVFYEGYNGRPLLDLRVYLSPHDVWTGTVSSDGEGAKFVTHDRSCVFPESVRDDNIRTSGLRFYSAMYDGQFPQSQDGGPAGKSRVREGSIQVITLADIVPGSETDKLIRHVQTGTPGEGAPPGCEQATGSFPGGDVVSPTNTLGGSASIVNVSEGTFYPYSADALSDFTGMPLYSASPDYRLLGSANSSDPILPGTVDAIVYVDGKPLTLSYENGIDAVSAVLMANNLYNEYLVSENLGANTDWIVNFPTKRFYVDTYYVGPKATAPFVETFRDGESNVEIGLRVYDREEGHRTAPDGISPPRGSKPNSLPFEVNVISWLKETSAGESSGVFGSNLRPNIQPYGDGGWASLDLASGDGGHALRPDVSGKVLRGLPIAGFMAYNVVNAQAQPSKLANYSGAFPHRTTTACSSNEPPRSGTQEPCT